MDYKELVKNLKKVTAGLQEDDAPKCAAVCEKAATAIETLLAERDAALSKCRGECDECAYADKDADDFPCCDCCYACMDWDKSAYWKWRGPTPPDRQQTGGQEEKPKEIYNDGKYRAVAIVE